MRWLIALALLAAAAIAQPPVISGPLTGVNVDVSVIDIIDILVPICEFPEVPVRYRFGVRFYESWCPELVSREKIIGIRGGCLCPEGYFRDSATGKCVKGCYIYQSCIKPLRNASPGEIVYTQCLNGSIISYRQARPGECICPIPGQVYRSGRCYNPRCCRQCIKGQMQTELTWSAECDQCAADQILVDGFCGSIDRCNCRGWPLEICLDGEIIMVISSGLCPCPFASQVRRDGICVDRKLCVKYCYQCQRGVIRSVPCRQRCPAGMIYDENWNCISPKECGKCAWCIKDPYERLVFTYTNDGSSRQCPCPTGDAWSYELSRCIPQKFCPCRKECGWIRVCRNGSLQEMLWQDGDCPCKQGYIYDVSSGRCVLNCSCTGPVLVCENGQVYIRFANPESGLCPCPNGLVWKDGVCIPKDQCPCSGKMLACENGMVTTILADYKVNRCPCPAGYVWQAGICIPQTNCTFCRSTLWCNTTSDGGRTILQGTFPGACPCPPNTAILATATGIQCVTKEECTCVGTVRVCRNNQITTVDANPGSRICPCPWGYVLLNGVCVPEKECCSTINYYCLEGGIVVARPECGQRCPPGFVVNSDGKCIPRVECQNCTRLICEGGQVIAQISSSCLCDAGYVEMDGQCVNPERCKQGCDRKPLRICVNTGEVQELDMIMECRCDDGFVWSDRWLTCITEEDCKCTADELVCTKNGPVFQETNITDCNRCGDGMIRSPDGGCLDMGSCPCPPGMELVREFTEEPTVCANGYVIKDRIIRYRPGECRCPRGLWPIRIPTADGSNSTTVCKKVPCRDCPDAERLGRVCRDGTIVYSFLAKSFVCYCEQGQIMNDQGDCIPAQSCIVTNCPPGAEQSGAPIRVCDPNTGEIGEFEPFTLGIKDCSCAEGTVFADGRCIDEALCKQLASAKR